MGEQGASPAHAQFVENIVAHIKAALSPELFTHRSWKVWVVKQIAELRRRGMGSLEVSKIANEQSPDSMRKLADGVAAGFMHQLRYEIRDSLAAGEIEPLPGEVHSWEPSAEQLERDVVTLSRAAEISRTWGDEQLMEQLEDLEAFARMAAKWRREMTAFLADRRRGRRTDPSTFIAEACRHALPDHPRPAAVAQLLCRELLGEKVTQTELRRRLTRRHSRSRQPR